tara:strand:- start:50 stop:253 length:204 start_codon:yes stop_codon:yes gene_type:complete
MTTSGRYVTTEEGGRQNMFAAEPQIEVIEGYDYWKNAELINGRLAMIGLVAAVINYGLFGWIIPGIV